MRVALQLRFEKQLEPAGSRKPKGFLCCSLRGPKVHKCTCVDCLPESKTAASGTPRPCKTPGLFPASTFSVQVLTYLCPQAARFGNLLVVR
eukprot:4568604-Amphidinium_carterae.2